MKKKEKYGIGNKKSRNLYKNKYLCLLKHDKQTDRLSKSFTGCYLIQRIFTKNLSCLSKMAAKKITFSHSGMDGLTDGQTK